MREVKNTTNEILEAYINLLNARPEFMCELEHMLADELANAKKVRSKANDISF